MDSVCLFTLAADKEATLFCEGRAESWPDQHSPTQKCRALLVFHCRSKHISIHGSGPSRKAMEFKNQLVLILCQFVRKLICSSRVSFLRTIYCLLYGFRASAGVNGFQQNLSNEKFPMCWWNFLYVLPFIAIPQASSSQKSEEDIARTRLPKVFLKHLFWQILAIQW